MPTKYRAKGHKVVSLGNVCRVKGSKKAARRVARHLNDLHLRKLQGGCTLRPLDTWCAA